MIDSASVAEHRAAKKRALFPRWTERVTGAMADAPTKADRILALDEQADRMHRQLQEPLTTTVVHAGTRMLESGQWYSLTGRQEGRAPCEWPGKTVDPMTYLSINGEVLYSEVAGAGDPVLMLHGGFCSLESLRGQSDALVEDYQVFAFERSGHGRSADIDGDYSYARGIADTLAFLDAQGLKSVHVIGYSDGAIIGLMLAMAHPERVRSLVAISANLDPTVFTPAAGNGPRLSSPPSAPNDGEPKPDLERMHYGRLSPDGAGHADAVLAKLMRLWTSEPNIDPAQLAAVSAPTLIMSGDRDSIPPAHSLLIAASIPGAQLSIVPGTGHGLIAERPELISTLIRDFLAHA